MVKPLPAETIDVKILCVAADHLRRFGLTRTTIVAIAADVGMSHANVYRYFPSKEALIDAVAAQWLKPIESGLRDIADGPDPADDKLERMLSALQRAYRSTSADDPNLFRIFAAGVEEGRGIARKHRARVQSEVQRVVEEGINGGLFAMRDTRRALALIFDALHRFLHPVSVRMDGTIPAAQVEARFGVMMRLVLRALATGRA
ncbi:MAG TPA: TetR/AcrR family transcriptional regulator [Beijerinckiaceae bacterium]|jgi:AcrR family transcriptional regulator|nr:TetR/AcrR family transcriptional regulator [Beijerinckiaceae bacterium]